MILPGGRSRHSAASARWAFACSVAVLLSPHAGAAAEPDLSRRAEPLMPVETWVTADDYPVQALRNEEQGVVEISFRVLPNGRVTACAVDKGSGSELLDAMACALVQVRGRYKPELNSMGRAVESVPKTVRLTWKLPEDVPEDIPFGQPFTSEMRIDVDAAGKVIDCEVTKAVAMPAGDPCLDAYDGDLRAAPLLDAAGKPIPARIIISSSVTATPR